MAKSSTEIRSESLLQAAKNLGINIEILEHAVHRVFQRLGLSEQNKTYFDFSSLVEMAKNLGAIKTIHETGGVVNVNSIINTEILGNFVTANIRQAKQSVLDADISQLGSEDFAEITGPTARRRLAYVMAMCDAVGITGKEVQAVVSPPNISGVSGVLHEAGFFVVANEVSKALVAAREAIDGVVIEAHSPTYPQVVSELSTRIAKASEIDFNNGRQSAEDIFENVVKATRDMNKRQKLVSFLASLSGGQT